jgi:hypothetical protein
MSSTRALPLYLAFFGFFDQSRDQCLLARDLHFARELNQFADLADFFFERLLREPLSHFGFHFFGSFRLYPARHLATDSRKALNELIQRIVVFQVLKQCLYRNPCAAENRGATEDFRIDCYQ